jgi:hypothetical protein
MIKIAALALVACLVAPGIAAAAPGDDEDRYGPPPAPFVDPAAPDSVQPTLTWPGKAAVSPRRLTQAYAAPTSQAYAPAPYAPAPYVQAAAPAQAVAALPTNIYAPPPSPLMQPAAPAASAQVAAGQPPRFYSLHREFGLTPDPAPAPLPTQFFAASADLAEPPPPPPPHVLPAGQQAMTASARARADAGDPDAAPATLDNSAP